MKKAGSGDVDGVEAALDAGAYVNAVDRKSNAALHRACYGGHEAVAAALLDAGADPTAVGQDGMHPLHFACKFGHATVVASLLSVGADLLATTASGLTARLLAIDSGHQDCVDVIDLHLGEPSWLSCIFCSESAGSHLIT